MQNAGLVGSQQILVPILFSKKWWRLRLWGCLKRGYPPFFNDEISEFIIAVTGGGCITFVQRQDQMCGIGSNHKDPYIQHISSCQHNFTLAVRMFVGGIFVECHLGGETAFLGRNCQVNDTKREKIMRQGTPNNYVYSITYHFSSWKCTGKAKQIDKQIVKSKAALSNRFLLATRGN